MNDRTFLVLGGAGLVGYQVAHRIARDLAPECVVVAARRRERAEQAVADLAELVPEVAFVPESGDMFVRSDLAQLPRRELLERDESREAAFEGLLGSIDAAYERSRLAEVVGRYRPDVVVDAVNTATAISYQDVYTSALAAERDMEALLEGQEVSPAVVARDVEGLLLSLSLPQLIRHVRILNRALRAAGTRLYLKVGTSGTGGMGLNIPYTHSEDRPSAQLLTKSAVAFAHSGLLFLLARTPGGPAVKEIKPAALIGYADVAHQTVWERGEAVHRYRAVAEPVGERLALRLDPGGFERQSDLQVPVVDTGENGVFAKGEFEVITAPGQMEMVTPEEIAALCIHEIVGANTGRDVIAALDGAALGPSYRGGALRAGVLDELARLQRESGVPSVALGQLGPPELGKLLWEAELLALAFGDVTAVLAVSPEAVGERVGATLEARPELRDTIVSVGLPILSFDGETLWRGPAVRIPEVPGAVDVAADASSRDEWADRGWVDLRPRNWARWQRRLSAVRDSQPGKAQRGSAGVVAALRDDRIEPGALVAWLLVNEMGGVRIK